MRDEGFNCRQKGATFAEKAPGCLPDHLLVLDRSVSCCLGDEDEIDR